MTVRPNNRPAAPPREVADTGAAISIEPAPGGGVTIRVTYPQERRQQDRIVLIVVCAVLAILPFVAWLIFRHQFAAPLLVGAGLLAAVIGIPSVIVRESRWSRSYVFAADASGLTIESSNDRRVQRQSLARGDIADVVIGFGQRRGPGTPAYDSWLLIQSTRSSPPDIECLYNLGGEHLVHVADALRAALGMPKRTWP